METKPGFEDSLPALWPSWRNLRLILHVFSRKCLKTAIHQSVLLRQVWRDLRRSSDMSMARSFTTGHLKSTRRDTPECLGSCSRPAVREDLFFHIVDPIRHPQENPVEQVNVLVVQRPLRSCATQVHVTQLAQPEINGCASLKAGYTGAP